MPLRFSGVGGREMTAAGLTACCRWRISRSSALPRFRRRLPRIAHHLFRTVRAVLARRPDALVVIDSPGYTLRRRAAGARFDRSIPIVKYVSPSVWAWRPWARPLDAALHRSCAGAAAVRARRASPARRPAMHLCRPSADRGGRQAPAERGRGAPPARPSRRSCWRCRAAAAARSRGWPAFSARRWRWCRQRVGPIEVVVPTVPHLLARVDKATASWPVKPRIVVELASKQAAFRIARAALAKSGTTTLELAVAGVPMVAAYKVSALEAFVIRRAGAGAVLHPRQSGARREHRARDRAGRLHAGTARAALGPLIGDTPERRRQVEAFARLDAIMEIGSRAPAARAADIVLGRAAGRRCALGSAAATARLAPKSGRAIMTVSALGDCTRRAGDGRGARRHAAARGATGRHGRSRSIMATARRQRARRDRAHRHRPPRRSGASRS